MDPNRKKLIRWALVWVGLLAVPLVPFTVMVAAGHDPFQDAAEAVRGRPAAAGVCFALLASDVFLPIPSSFVALVSGQAAGTLAGGILNLVAITLGHLIGYAIARRWGAPAVRRFVGESGEHSAGRTWRDGATAALIISRPVPVLAEAVSMYAGLTAFSARRFAIVITLANIPHSFIYSWAGANVRDLDSLNTLVLACVGVPTAGYAAFGVRRFLVHRRARTTGE